MSKFDVCFNEIIKREGGYVFSSNDSGGETKYGITKEVAVEYGYTGNMKDLDINTARDIYLTKYWRALKLDALYSEPVCMEIFDIAVNMGTKTAALYLQKAVIVSTDTDLTVDGVIGDKTISAVNSIKSNSNTEKTLIKLLNIQQAYHYFSICLKYKTQRTFINGWLTRV